MKNYNKNKPSILTIIIILIVFTTYSVITLPIPDDDSSLTPTTDHPDPSLPTLVKIKFDSIPQPGEFWEMIRVDDYSDTNSNDRQNFGIVGYYSPVYFNNAYNRFGPHLFYDDGEEIDKKYQSKDWYKLCYLE